MTIRRLQNHDHATLVSPPQLSWPCAAWALPLTLAALMVSHPSSNVKAQTPPAPEAPKVTWSQTIAAPDDSYNGRFVNAQSVHDIDPNIWAYTAEFAAKNKMPAEWIAPDLRGAEAIAFRVESNYTTCGWGGNPKACRENPPQCVVDVYFNNTKHALPWDETMRVTDIDFFETSVRFSGLSRVDRPRSGSGSWRRTPFYEPFKKQEFEWYESSARYPNHFNRMGTSSYDRNLGLGLSFVKLSSFGCYPSNRFSLRTKSTDTSPAITIHTVELPESWLQRTSARLTDLKAKDEAYYKQVFENMKRKP